MKNRANIKTYKSAVDWWYYAIILMSIGLISSSYVAIQDQGLLTPLLLIAVGIMSVGLPLWLLFSTQYTITVDALLVRSGPFKWHIPLDQIHSIQRTSSPLSSPALSLRRLEIRYGDGKYILLSPTNPDAFAEDLGFSNQG